MKRIRLVIMLSALALGMIQVRADIAFRLLPLKHADELTQAAAEVIDSKLATAFTRVEALSENTEWALVVDPELIIEESAATEGMIREVNKIKADLVLTAKNSYDGHTFATATLPLSATTAGGEAKAMKALAGSLKPTAPVFVRFVKQARQRIAEYYSANCGSILQQAQTLASTGRPEAAYSLLAAIDPSLDCYDSASTLMMELHALMTPDVEPAPEPVEEVEPAPVVEPEPVPDPEPQDVAEPEPDPAPAPEVNPAPAPVTEIKPAEPQPAWTANVRSSAPDCWRARLKSIDFDPENERLIIVVGFTNVGLPYERNVGIGCSTMVYGNGDLGDKGDVTVNGKKYCTFDAPRGVEVNLRIVINNYGSGPVPVSIVRFDTASGSTLTISDIKP